MVATLTQQSTEVDSLKKAFAATIANHASSIPKAANNQQITDLLPLIPHIIETATYFQDWLTDDDFIYPFNSLGNVYEAQGDYLEATRWHESCLDIVRQRLGHDHLETASSLNNLAASIQAQGRFSDANALYRQALDL